MDRTRAIQLLPQTYALALRLLDAGTDQTVIAQRLQIEPEAIPLLLRVAEEKLANLMNQ